MILRRFSTVSAALLLCAGLSLAACNDDPSQQGPPDGWTIDAGDAGGQQQEDTGGGTEDSGPTTDDAGTTDADGQMPEDTGGSGGMDGGDGDEDTGPGNTDTGPGDQDGGPMDAAPQDGGPMDGGDAVAMDGGGMDTADTPNYDVPPNPDALPMSFGPGSFVNKLKVKRVCCTDYDNDGNPDNAIAKMLDGVAGLSSSLPDVDDSNQNIKTQIKNGSLVVLFEYDNWTNLKNQMSLDMFAHSGTDANPMNGFMPNLNGTGTFNILQSSYYGPNGKPKSQFKNVSVTNKKLVATGGTVVLPLDFGGGLTVNLRLLQPRLEATVDTARSKLTPSDGVFLKNGKISGIVLEKDIFDAVNDLARSQGCTCGQGNDVFTPGPKDSYQCNNSCSGGSLLCGGFCTAIPGFVENYSDQDISPKNGYPDAFSFGATFETVAATFVGTTP